MPKSTRYYNTNDGKLDSHATDADGHEFRSKRELQAMEAEKNAKGKGKNVTPKYRNRGNMKKSGDPRISQHVGYVGRNY